MGLQLVEIIVRIKCVPWQVNI